MYTYSKYGEEKKWYGSSVDCANFASQILYAGGISMGPILIKIRGGGGNRKEIALYHG
ncbi:amidase domain-containing protein [Olegusella massiliensis]|uniref:amidase domain-containing protein n=1 Tax=Olegusella massiliensis TaxID=1776381 RepID=UPI0011DC8FE7